VDDSPPKPDHGHGFLHRIVHLGAAGSSDAKELQ
jgi:hypothetical protein